VPLNSKLHAGPEWNDWPYSDAKAPIFQHYYKHSKGRQSQRQKAAEACNAIHALELARDEKESTKLQTTKIAGSDFGGQSLAQQSR
jgi:hypothetical protein